MANTATLQSPSSTPQVEIGPSTGSGVLNPLDKNSGATRGSIDFTTQQKGPKTVAEQLTAARATIAQAAGKHIPPIEDIFAPPTEKSQQK